MVSERQARLVVPLLWIGCIAWFVAFLWAAWQREAYYDRVTVVDLLPNPPAPFWVDHPIPFSFLVALGAGLVSLLVITVWRVNE